MPEPVHPTIMILAGNYQQYIHWCKDMGVSPRSRMVRYVYDVSDLRGRRNMIFVHIGTFWTRHDAATIYEAAKLSTDMGDALVTIG